MKIVYPPNLGRSDMEVSHEEVIAYMRKMALLCDTSGLDGILFTQRHFGCFKRTNRPNQQKIFA